MKVSVWDKIIVLTYLSIVAVAGTLFECIVQIISLCTLVQLPSHHPVFDSLHYVKTEGSVFENCKRSKTGQWEGLGMRLNTMYIEVSCCFNNIYGASSISYTQQWWRSCIMIHLTRTAGPQESYAKSRLMSMSQLPCLAPFCCTWKLGAVLHVHLTPIPCSLFKFCLGYYTMCS